jgi:Uma2 family endonuclease
MTLSDVRLWTVDEYHRMLDAKILTERDRVELIGGKIIYMSPQRPPHSATVQRASSYLKKILGDRATVRIQAPITLSINSEPEPDIAIVRNDARDYFDRHPSAADTFLLIEVADTTLTKDITIKASIYAEVGISEYWVLDVNNRQVYLFRQPKEDKYQEMSILSIDLEIYLLTQVAS